MLTYSLAVVHNHWAEVRIGWGGTLRNRNPPKVFASSAAFLTEYGRFYRI